jgi:hypothetical protein
MKQSNPTWLYVSRASPPVFSSLLGALRVLALLAQFLIPDRAKLTKSAKAAKEMHWPNKSRAGRPCYPQNGNVLSEHPAHVPPSSSATTPLSIGTFSSWSDPKYASAADIVITTSIGDGNAALTPDQFIALVGSDTRNSHTATTDSESTAWSNVMCSSCAPAS